VVASVEDLDLTIQLAGEILSEVVLAREAVGPCGGRDADAVVVGVVSAT
jgi:hypothetical protein